MAAKGLTYYPLFSFVTGIPYAPSPYKGEGKGGGDHYIVSCSLQSLLKGDRLALPSRDILDVLSLLKGVFTKKRCFMIEKQVWKLSLTVAFLDEKAQIDFFKNWMREIKDRRHLLEEILVVAANTYYPTAKIEKWMESRLEKDMSLTPRRVAYEYRYYKAIDKRMEPYLRRIARKVKNRILIRSRRSAMKNVQETL